MESPPRWIDSLRHLTADLWSQDSTLRACRRDRRAYCATSRLPAPMIHFALSDVYRPGGRRAPSSKNSFTLNRPATPSGEVVFTLFFDVIVRLAAVSQQPLRSRYAAPLLPASISVMWTLSLSCSP